MDRGENMRILVTGGSGYIGSMLARLLREHEVTNVDLVYPLENQPSNHFKADICNDRYFKPLIEKAEVIVHLAGIVGYPACNADPGRAWEVNVDATRTLSRYAESRLIIYSSTQSVYGAAVELCTESSPIIPTSLYAETKAASETILGNTNLIVLRFGTGFGVSPKMRNDLLIHDLVRIALREGKIELYQPNARRSFIPVSDMARAIVFAMNNAKKMLHGSFNVGDESINLTKRDIVSAIVDRLGCEVVEASGEDLEKRDYFVSYDKIHEVGFQLRSDFNTELDAIIQYYKGE
jgi:nucleoside-diphosphate-sugar epimerase